ncbi:MAG: glycosyltransferase, partial [Candidatus Omnitrophota bacterium]
EDYLDIAKSLDILVLPTLHDDCPRIILECLGLGTPVIASNTGGIPEILKYDELMFNPLEKGALEKKLERMIKDPSYLAEIKKLCSERKPFFDKDWGEEIVRLVKEN